MPEQMNILHAIRTIVKEEIRPVEDHLDKKITDFKEKILSAIDTNNKKLDRILAEHPAMNYSIDENREKIKQHESRISMLESRTVLA